MCPTAVIDRLAVVGMSPGSSSQSQPRPSQGVLDALAALPPIPVAELPSTIHLEECPNMVGVPVERGPAIATVPSPGDEHESIASGDTRVTYLYLQTSKKGVVTVDSDEREVDDGTDSPVGGCNQDLYDPFGSRVTSTFNYYTNVSDFRPVSMSGDQARLGLKSGFDIVLTTRNDCGLPDVMPMSARLVSDTSRRPCSYDGVSVMGFGDRSGANAVACLSSSDGVRTSADVLVNSFDSNWVLTITSTCRHSRHLQSTMAHEVGHVYGLRDLYAQSGNSQTLYNSGGRCSEHRATLGYGDWLGFERKY